MDYELELERLRAENASLRATQEKIVHRILTMTPLSRLDEFAKAALTGFCAHVAQGAPLDPIARDALHVAQATIRAIDGAGGT